MKKQLIIKDSQTAREVNPWGENPNKYEWVVDEKLNRQVKVPSIKQRRWQQAESSLNEYRIEGLYLENEVHLKSLFTIGSIYTCETNEETLTCIIVLVSILT